MSAFLRFVGQEAASSPLCSESLRTGGIRTLHRLPFIPWYILIWPLRAPGARILRCYCLTRISNILKSATASSPWGTSAGMTTVCPALARSFSPPTVTSASPSRM